MKKNIIILSVLCLLLANTAYAKKVYYSKVSTADTSKDVNIVSLEKGFDYCKDYKLGAAQKYFESALKKDPKSSQAHNGLGLSYLLKVSSSDMEVIKNKQQILDYAKNEFESAIKYNKKNAQAYNNLGRVYKELGVLDKAEENYQKALQIDTKYSEAMCNLGYIDFLKNKTPEAIEKYKKSIAYNSNNSTAYFYLAEAYASQSKYSDALAEIGTSLSLFNNNALAQNALAKVYRTQGNEAAAINAFKKAVTIKPENIEAYLGLAEIYQNRGDNELAISELKNILSINPSYNEAYLKLADMLLIENKPEKAISYYQKVVGDPVYSAYALKGLSKAYYNNSKSAFDTGYTATTADYVTLQNELLKAVDSNPKDLQLYLALLRTSKMIADDNLTEIYLNKIVARSDFSPVSAVIKGEAYLLCNQPKEAKAAFDEALGSVNNLQDCLAMGELFVLDKQYDMATTSYYKALNFDPLNKRAKFGMNTIARNQKIAESHYNLAYDYFKSHQYVSSVEELKKTLSLNPKHMKAQLLMAKSYQKLAKYAQSAAYYQVYLASVDIQDKQYKKYTKTINRLQKKAQRAQLHVLQDL